MIFSFGQKLNDEQARTNVSINRTSTSKWSNPVRAGIVKQAEEYIYSSASNYMQEKGILKCVELPDNPVRDPLKPSTFDKYLRM